MRRRKIKYSKARFRKLLKALESVYDWYDRGQITTFEFTCWPLVAKALGVPVDKLVPADQFIDWMVTRLPGYEPDTKDTQNIEDNRLWHDLNKAIGADGGELLVCFDTSMKVSDGIQAAQAIQAFRLKSGLDLSILSGNQLLYNGQIINNLRRNKVVLWFYNRNNKNDRQRAIPPR